MRTFIIAEAGVNHNGCIDRALRMVEAAANAGVDAIKFQTFIAEEEISEYAPKAEYQLDGTSPDESQLDMVRALELTRDHHLQLIECCGKYSIEFISSPFDLKSINLLRSLELDHIKIASGEITNLPLLREIARCPMSIIMSTGMAHLDEISAALDVLYSEGVNKSRITILHCNTEYPTPMCDVNLNVLTTLNRSLGLPVGYSDHTLGVEVPIAAVALGAQVIEKHFTLDRTLPGPDHKASATVSELQDMVSAIRNIEIALGSSTKQPTPSEQKNIAIARKSLVARKPIKTGEAFSSDNLTAKRPGTGVSPMEWDRYLGTPSPRSYLADELID
jgi:N,N'-diacetyllegionaminate synthase